jgi:hypothetical protein
VLNTYRFTGAGTGTQVVLSSRGYRLDFRTNGVITKFPSSGFAGSLTAAGQLLCRAINCVSGGIATTLQNNIQTLDKVAHSGGNWVIGFRQESGNRWYVDFIKGSTGFHGTGFGSDTAAVNHFCGLPQVRGLC